MKKLIALLLCALLAALPALALAESPFEDLIGDLIDDFPDERSDDESPRGDAGSGDTFPLNVNGETIPLVYDPTPQYSSIQGGLVQASYFAYGADGVTLYELYIIFPDTAKAGMVITPEYAAMTDEESSVVLIVSGTGEERYYTASLMDGNVYPAGSNFTIAIEDVRESASATTYSGKMSASLVALDVSSGEPAATLSIPETPFSFTVGGSSTRHVSPSATEAPADLKKV